MGNTHAGISCVKIFRSRPRIATAKPGPAIGRVEARS